MTILSFVGQLPDAFLSGPFTCYLYFLALYFARENKDWSIAWLINDLLMCCSPMAAATAAAAMFRVTEKLCLSDHRVRVG